MTCAVAFGIKFPVAEWRETDAHIRCAGRVACVVVDVTRGQRVAAELIFLCVMRGIGAGNDTAGQRCIFTDRDIKSAVTCAQPRRLYDALIIALDFLFAGVQLRRGRAGDRYDGVNTDALLFAVVAAGVLQTFDM